MQDTTTKADDAYCLALTCYMDLFQRRTGEYKDLWELKDDELAILEELGASPTLVASINTRLTAICQERQQHK